MSNQFGGIKTPHIQENIMVLSNLLEKAHKTAPVEEDLFFIHENLRKEHEAALELLSVLNTKLVTSDGSPHAATILSAAAWLTGAGLCRSFQNKERSLPGTIVTSQDVNQEWENLVYLLEEYNFQKADIPVGRIVLAAMATPHFFKPQVEMPYVQRELQEQYNAVMQKYGFDALEGTHVGVILCSILIQQYSRAGMIDTDAATGVAAQEIFEAARQCILP
jgi:hypothetical protein